MAKKLYLKLQSPSIEHSFILKDTSNNDVTITLGLRKHNEEKSKAIKEELYSKYNFDLRNTFQQEFQDLLDRKNVLELSLKDEKGKEVEISKELIDEFTAITVSLSEIVDKSEKLKQEEEEAIFSIIQKDILYFKNVHFEIYDEEDNFLEKLKVSDTRYAEPCEFWENPKECFNASLKEYLSNSKFKEKVIEIYGKLLNNIALIEEESSKN